MAMDKKQLTWLIVGIISLLVLINSATDLGDPDKKQASAANTGVRAGAIGIGAAVGFGVKKTAVPLILGIFTQATFRALILPIAALFAFLPSLLGYCQFVQKCDHARNFVCPY